MPEDEQAAVEITKRADDVDSGWDEPATAGAPAVVAVAAPSVPSPLTAPAASRVTAASPAVNDDIDDAWDEDEDEDDAAADDEAEKGAAKAVAEAADGHAVAAVSAPLRAKPARRAKSPSQAKPAPRAVPGLVAEASARRTLSKKERRELERKNRVHAAQKDSEQKRSRRASRREEAKRLAEQRLEERAVALAAAKKERRREQRVEAKTRAKRRAQSEDADTKPSAGTERRGGKAARTRGRLQKNTGGGWIVAIIALITLATGLYAWSKR